MIVLVSLDPERWLQNDLIAFFLKDKGLECAHINMQWDDGDLESNLSLENTIGCFLFFLEEVDISTSHRRLEIQKHLDKLRRKRPGVEFLAVTYDLAKIPLKEVQHLNLDFPANPLVDLIDEIQEVVKLSSI